MAFLSKKTSCLRCSISLCIFLYIFVNTLNSEEFASVILLKNKSLSFAYEKVKRIAVIGAGPAGLCSAKNSIDYGHDVIVYERNSTVGGLWNYSDQVGNDEYGIPIHSSMYSGVVTNVPVQCMGFLGFPFEGKHGKSFLAHEEVLAFYQSYANHYNLQKVIKFQNYVENVKPIQNNRWEILSRDLRTNTYEVNICDAIFICNGHYSTPNIPHFDGLEKFKGYICHSHDYRRPDRFKNETVLIIGSGPSGKDILYEVATEAEKVIFSHNRDLSRHVLPLNVIKVGNVKRFTAKTVQLVGDVEHQITCVLFCTGYTFSFPFLSVDCGLSVQDKFEVTPLYKHLLNINFPKMAIVGLQICAYSYMYDLQVRLCLRFWNNEIELPTKDEMLADFRPEKKRREETGNTRQLHLLGGDQNSYLRDLSYIIKIPEVVLKIYDDCNERRLQYPNNYREDNYTIIDDETFERS